MESARQRLRRQEGMGGQRRRGDHAGSDSSDMGGQRRRGDHADSGSPGGGRTRGDHSGSGGMYNPGGDSGAASPADLNDAENDSGLYSPDDRPGFWSRLRGRGGGKGFGFLKSRRNRIIAAFVTITSGGLISISAFLFLGIFDLPNFMKNVEQAAFQRYQVDISGRSAAWLGAYMELRFSEVDDPNLAPKDRDNLLFRSDTVSRNKPLRDWYKNLRGKTGKFEQDVFERQGIKFTSVAKREGHSIKFRPGVMTIPDSDRTLTFDPSQKAIQAIQKGDPNAFNGELRKFVEVHVFENDKQARAALKELTRKEYPGVWKAVKRFHLRRDIQNMIGVRKWRFFENSRNKLHEKKIDIRNKILTQALPEDSKSGAFIKCLFGVSDCRASSDPADPKAREYTPSGSKKQGDKTDGDPKNPQPVGDGSGESTLKAGSDAAAAAGDVAGKIISKLVSRAGTLSLLDSLARFDESIKNHSLSKFVTQAKTAQVTGLYTVFATAGDQLTTGEQTGVEVKAFMDKFARPTASEGWTSVVSQPSGAGKVSADSTDYTEAKSKKEFCSVKHQAEMDKHPLQAEREYQYQCPKDKVGGPNQAQSLEDQWNSGPGLILHPFLAAFHAATGGIFDVFNAVTSAVIDPVVSATLSLTGTQDNVEAVASAVGQKALAFGGGVLDVNKDTPSGQVANFVIEGGATTSEATMRDQGAASTNTVTRALAEKNIIAFQADQEHTGFANRYLSLSNPKSLLATTLFAISNTSFGNIGQDLFGIFSSALSSPFRVLTQPVHAAAPDGYAAAKFAGIDTFDLPPQCLGDKTINMTPRQATNADDLHILKPSELNWDLMTNTEDWYDAIYAKVGDNEALAMKVWNCGLFDNTVRGGISAPYGYAGANSFQSEGGTGAGGGAGDSPTISNDARQLAQEILDNDKISKTGRYVMEDLKHTANGQPAYDDVKLALNLLQFMAELGKTTPYTITSITGAGCGHSNDTCVGDGGSSNHYIGKAVDFGCGFDEAKADEVAKKYGLMAGNERCDGGVDHSHFSKDGY